MKTSGRVWIINALTVVFIIHSIFTSSPHFGSNVWYFLTFFGGWIDKNEYVQQCHKRCRPKIWAKRQHTKSWGRLSIAVVWGMAMDVHRRSRDPRLKCNCLRDRLLEMPQDSCCLTLKKAFTRLCRVLATCRHSDAALGVNWSHGCKQLGAEIDLRTNGWEIWYWMKKLWWLHFWLLFSLHSRMSRLSWI